MNLFPSSLDLWKDRLKFLLSFNLCEKGNNRDLVILKIETMRISYTTKEESNKLREDEFLKLSPVDRFYRFLELMQASKKMFPDKKDRSDSFQIVIQSNGK